MPRVSEEYRQARRAQIVSAAAGLFARDGFHATSMADVIAASGMSAGAVYGYFASKDEIIVAVAEQALSAADDVFTQLLANGASPPPVAAVTAVMDAVVGGAAHDPATGQDLTKVAVQVWAEAQRNPAVRGRADEVYRRLRGHFSEVARRWQAQGHYPPDADPDAVGAALLGLAQGFLLQRLLLADQHTDSYRAGVAALLGVSAPRASPTP